MDNLEKKAQEYWEKFLQKGGMPFCNQGEGIEVMAALYVIALNKGPKKIKKFVKVFTKTLTNDELKKLQNIAVEQEEFYPCKNYLFYWVFMHFYKKKNKKKK